MYYTLLFLFDKYLNLLFISDSFSISMYWILSGNSINQTDEQVAILNKLLCYII